MSCSLFQLNRLKTPRKGTPLLALPLLLAFIAPASVQAQPKAAPVLMGVVDEEKLAQSRSDFPLLVPKVLPQVAAKRKLTLIVTRQGLKWGQSKVPSVDVTADVLVLLRNLPVTPGALSGEQQAAARRALDALSALDVALRVGNLSYDAYNERLTNTSIAFDAALKGVPEGALKTQLLRAMQSFLDVRTAWDASFEAIKQGDKASEDRRAAMRAIMGSLLDAHGRQVIEEGADAERDKVRQEAFKPVRAAQEKPAREVEAADKLLSSLIPK